jgi:hypothetical protein
MFSLNSEGSAVSCGVTQLSGVHGCDVAAVIAKAKAAINYEDKAAELERKIEEAYDEKLYLTAYNLEDQLSELEEFIDTSPTVFVFSDNDRGNGAALAAAIKKARLGKVVETGWVVNPDSGNNINTWLWCYGVEKVKVKKPKAKAKKPRAVKKAAKKAKRK